MANMHLVTGRAGYEHVTSADQGILNAYFFGNIEAVLERGNQFAASIISNNIVRVQDGDLMMQGRFARLNENSYVDLTIENGTQGYSRNDLIVARYTKDVMTSVEEINLVVIKGENAASDPVDPACTKGNILDGTDFQNDIPLWRVSIEGLSITGLTCLYSTFGTSLQSLLELVAQSGNHIIPDGAAVSFADLVYLRRCSAGGLEVCADAEGTTFESVTASVFRSENEVDPAQENLVRPGALAAEATTPSVNGRINWTYE